MSACYCQVVETFAGAKSIRFCPLHEAAPDLLAVARQAAVEYRGQIRRTADDAEKVAWHQRLRQAEVAIAKAEGMAAP